MMAIQYHLPELKIKVSRRSTFLSGSFGEETVSSPFLASRGPYREGNGTPLQYSCLENPMDRGAWWAAIYGVAKSQTWLRDFTFTFHFHALEKEMATHSNVLAWRIPWTEEPDGLPSMGSHRVGHDWSDLAAEVLTFFYLLPLPPSSKPAIAVVSFSHLTHSSFCLFFFHFSGSILLHWAHLDNLEQSPHPTFNWLASLIASATL